MSPSILEEENAEFRLPLHTAIFCDDFKVVALLLNVKAKVLTRSSGTEEKRMRSRIRQRNSKPLSYYWVCQLHETLVELVKFGIVFVHSNYIPLHYTASKGSVDMPRALLGYRAHLSCRDVDES